MMLLQIHSELLTTILCYLRARDLSSLHQTCTTFSKPSLIRNVIHHFATIVYPPDLTRGYDTPEINGDLMLLDASPTFEILRNMEMLIVARVLSRPEPPLSQRHSGCFYVSKAWCKAALKWLDLQEDQRKERYKLKIEAVAAEAEEESGNRHGKKKNKHGHGKGKGKKQSKKIKKQERKRNKVMLDTLPPNPNVNHDLVCEHGYLKQSCGNGGLKSSSSTNARISHATSAASIGASRSARAKRRLMDKQAWKVLKKLYPEGVQLSTLEGECIQCAMEAEARRRNQEMQMLKRKEERKKPLQNEHLRKFYKRAKGGVPLDCLTIIPNRKNSERHLSSTCEGMNTAELSSGKKGSFFKSTNRISCPLVPGVYYVLPRAWCHKWRKYIKTGEGGRPCAPDTSVCLCDAHRLPLIPLHLESFLYGETSSLLGTSSDITMATLMNDGGIGETLPVSTLSSATNFQSSATAEVTATIRPVANSSSNIATIHDITLNRNTSASASTSMPRSLPVGFNPVDQRLGCSSVRSRSSQDFGNSGLETRPQYQQESRAHAEIDQQMISALRTSGLSEAEIQLQRLAMIQIEEERQHQNQRREENGTEWHQQYRFNSQENTENNISVNSIMAMMSPEDIRANLNAKLDRENKVVVEILTDTEFAALEEWWPEIHSSYALKFSVVDEESKGTEIMWTTAPCRACDASGYCNHDIVLRNRCRNWANATSPKKKKK